MTGPWLFLRFADRWCKVVWINKKARSTCYAFFQSHLTCASEGQNGLENINYWLRMARTGWKKSTMNVRHILDVFHTNQPDRWCSEKQSKTRPPASRKVAKNLEPTIEMDVQYKDCRNGRDYWLENTNYPRNHETRFAVSARASKPPNGTLFCSVETSTAFYLSMHTLCLLEHAEFEAIT